jgi:PAS domain S-box-containing protein
MSALSFARFPLRHHLLVLVAIALVPVVAFAATIVADLGRQQRTSVERGLAATVRALAIAVEREMASSVRALEVLATSERLDGGELRAFHAQVTRMVAAQDVWYAVALAAPDGRILLNTLRPFGEALPSIGDRDYFARLLASGHPAVSDLVTGRTIGQVSVAVAVPVQRDGALRYVLFAAIKPRAFGRILTAQAIPPDWIAAIADSREVIITRNRDAERFAGRELIQPLRDAVRAAPAGRGRYPVYDGPDVYAAWQRVETLGWTVTLGTPVSAVDGPVRRSVLGVALMGLMVTLAGGAIALLWGRRLSGAMTALASAATGVGGGAVPAWRRSGVAEVDAVGDALETAGRTIADQTIALVASQARLRRLVDANLIGIVIGDGDRITEANDVFLAILGCDRDDLRRGLRWPSITPPEYHALDRAAIREARRRGECTPYEKAYVRKDGSRVPVLIGGALVQPGHTEWVAFVLDLTAHERAEHERRLRTEAEAANRAKDEFLAVLSHELRTPLNAILTWTRMLRSGRLTAAGAADALDRIERSTRLQARLIGDLLDVSRIVAGTLDIERVPVSLAPVVEDAVASLHHEAELKQVQVRTRLPADLPPVLGDAQRLQQIVLNLVSNAIKFTPAGGRVDVDVRADGARIVLSVRDTGCGIEPDRLAGVFDRFRRSENSGGQANPGLGLGLAIVRHLVERHGGAVRAESAGPGQGALFTVDLPAWAEAPAGRIV